MRFAVVAMALIGSNMFMQPAFAVDCPPAGSGKAGVDAWSEKHCGVDAKCATETTTCNGQFTIKFLGATPLDELVTLEYEVCKAAATMDLSHWSVGLGQIGCLGSGFTLSDLVVAATKNGLPVTFEVGLDPTTQLLGVKFNEGFQGTCNTYTVTFDTSVLASGYTLSIGCVTMSTKAGSQDITGGTFVPGYACGLGPVCEFDPDQPPGCPSADHNCLSEGPAGCADVGCCTTVCAQDPFCCSTAWDKVCVEQAKELCAGCGGPGAGDCCTSNGTPFCDNRTCCEMVCAINPFCCETEWDSKCAALAKTFCPDRCPSEPQKGTLILTAEDCQNDAFPDVDGQQIIVQLSMQDLSTDVTGFQAFIHFDQDVLNYNGGLSSYTVSPFPLHITSPANAQTAPGTLQFDGTVGIDGAGTADDAKLVTIVFDVKNKCETTIIGFGGSNFDSELSFEGLPIPTNLAPTEEIALDDNPPSIECPPDIKVSADLFVPGEDGKPKFDPCVGAVVDYVVYVEDDCANVTVEYSHPSGSLFPIGATTVVVTATDKCGNQASCSFVVEVSATNKVSASVLLWGSQGTERCILFVTDRCDVNANASVTFGATDDGAKGLAVFEITCGDYHFLCAKDEQHTLWDTVLLEADLATQCWLATDQLVLRPGDTDNDGDVDINDVTWLIATWGAPHAPGGCPWDGTRDADFSNDGTVATEDYSLLSAQWLEKSACQCVEGDGPQGLDGPRSVLVGPLSPTARAADLDGNGIVDWRDVRIFEQRHGLPETLSRRMRTID